MELAESAVCSDHRSGPRRSDLTSPLFRRRRDRVESLPCADTVHRKSPVDSLQSALQDGAAMWTNPNDVLTPDQLRTIDSRAVSELGLPGVVLMENAGRHVAEWILALGAGEAEVVVAAGSGNNGGDGYVIARQLWTRGCPVRVLSVADPGTLRGDARINADAWIRLGGRLEVLTSETSQEEWERRLSQARWIVDALLGTGFSGALRPHYATAIRAINSHHSSTRVMSVDLPSGLDAERGCTGQLVVRADHTATFVARKPGFAAAAACLGDVRVFDIGVPADWIASTVLADRIGPVSSQNSHVHGRR